MGSAANRTAHVPLRCRLAAWCRLFDSIDPGYGFVAADVPELSIGVNSDHRERGVGTALLDAVIAQAAGRGYPAVILSVGDGNRARVLYVRAGFAAVGRNQGSVTLVPDLSRRQLSNCW